MVRRGSGEGGGGGFAVTDEAVEDGVGPVVAGRVAAAAAEAEGRSEGGAVVEAEKAEEDDGGHEEGGEELPTRNDTALSSPLQRALHWTFLDLPPALLCLNKLAFSFFYSVLNSIGTKGFRRDERTEEGGDRE